MLLNQQERPPRKYCYQSSEIYCLYKVDRPKRHHASRKPVGGDSIPGLGFYCSANLGDETRLPSDFSIVFTASELSVWDHFMSYSKEQRIFICNTFMKKSSWRKCRRKFRRQFSDSLVPDNTTIYSIVKKITRQALCKIRSLKWRKVYW